MRTVLFLLVLGAMILTGCSRGGQPAAPQPPAQGQAADPGIRAALAVLALERDEEHAVTPEQATKILPWLRVLRDMRPDDLEAAQAIADEVFAVFTAEQRAALERIRERARDRRTQPGSQGGPPGGGAPGAPPGGGPGSGQGAPGGPGQAGGPADPARRAEFRGRAIERAIRLLEAKIPPTTP